jgi:hypothetical protein
MACPARRFQWSARVISHFLGNRNWEVVVTWLVILVPIVWIVPPSSEGYRLVQGTGGPPKKGRMLRGVRRSCRVNRLGRP